MWSKKILAGFKSLWITPCECKNSRPLNSYFMILNAVPASVFLCLFFKYSSNVPPLYNYIWMYKQYIAEGYLLSGNEIGTLDCITGATGTTKG